ncbi:hypothetical protein SLNWT_5726 [Streptomyces albus]|uniref:Uncharacterized protein n=1 Tax=Streptomyces albus (strain ATCC 21838 / DSM 41398 / FERM P-419 / JCM 4703 / NBRC 107858) TaxID=1081613 RepID=A0A0B5F6V0_STRA4|nr:hypothetical protein SLNWT_5726 [Streptomyces albus]AOU80403.1 hypothetical protein SLNHY_5712 [Streptomyces albus]AYN36113.1 hypothetical protein DUI70_5620 [Streptomyces albus]
MVGGDGAGDCNTHGWNAPGRRGRVPLRYRFRPAPADPPKLPDSRAFFACDPALTVRI